MPKWSRMTPEIEEHQKKVPLTHDGIFRALLNGETLFTMSNMGLIRTMKLENGRLVNAEGNVKGYVELCVKWHLKT